MLNIAEIITNRAHYYPEKECLVSKGKRYSYTEVNNRANRFASFLEYSKLAPGDKMAVLCKNHADNVISFLGAAKLGIITVQVNWRLAVQEIEYILSHSKAMCLLYDDTFEDVVEQLKDKMNASIFIKVGTKGSNTDINFESIISGQTIEQEPVLKTAGDEPILIMYTSGTTGKPKGVMLSHVNLFMASVALTHSLDWRNTDRFLLVVPLFHIGGFAMLIANLHMGATTVLQEDFAPQKVWEQIGKENITNMMSVPTMLNAMLPAFDSEQHSSATLRYFICGASPVHKQLIEGYKHLGINVHQVYGITEFSGPVTFWTHEMGEDKNASMGKAVVHGEVKIVDPNTGMECSIGEIGEIICRGPHVFKGYLNDEEATNKVIKDGWYYSGDLGKIDEDGFLYVIDRLKDLIISGGENIYSAEVESVIQSHPAVSEVAVIGVPDAEWGEIPRAYVVPKLGETVTKEDIYFTCRQNLASFKCVKEVVFTDALPRNASGKILKNVLRNESTVKQ